VRYDEHTGGICMSNAWQKWRESIENGDRKQEKPDARKVKAKTEDDGRDNIFSFH
jgi:hypothetical protein